MVRRYDPGRDDVLRTDDNRVGSHRDHWIEIARGERVTQVAEIVGKEGLHESEVGAQRRFEQIALPLYLDLLLSSLHGRAEAGLREDAAQSVPPARMRSMSVPWGTSSTSSSPAIICF